VLGNASHEEYRSLKRPCVPMLIRHLCLACSASPHARVWRDWRSRLRCLLAARFSISAFICSGSDRSRLEFKANYFLNHQLIRNDRDNCFHGMAYVNSPKVFSIIPHPNHPAEAPQEGQGGQLTDWETRATNTDSRLFVQEPSAGPLARGRCIIYMLVGCHRRPVRVGTS
jgi:hypothetical protein